MESRVTVLYLLLSWCFKTHLHTLSKLIFITTFVEWIKQAFLFPLYRWENRFERLNKPTQFTGRDSQNPDLVCVPHLPLYFVLRYLECKGQKLSYKLIPSLSLYRQLDVHSYLGCRCYLCVLETRDFYGDFQSMCPNMLISLMRKPRLTGSQYPHPYLGSGTLRLHLRWLHWKPFSIHSFSSKETASSLSVLLSVFPVSHAELSPYKASVELIKEWLMASKWLEGIRNTNQRDISLGLPPMTLTVTVAVWKPNSRYLEI